jgi:hypothetical protein
MKILEAALSNENPRPKQHHYEAERKLVDAEISLASSLEKLSEVEERLGLGRDADHRLEQAAELEDRARSHVDHLRHELEAEAQVNREDSETEREVLEAD